MPIEKRRKGSKNIDEYIADHEIKNDQIQNNKRTSSRNVEANKNNHTQNYEINNSRGPNSKLTGWVIAIGIILATFMIFSFYKFNTTNNNLDYIQSLETKIKDLDGKNKSLEGKISSLEKKGDWEVYQVNYEGGSSITNNLKWIGEKSLGFPEYLKGKNCYILGSKLDGAEGGTVRGYLGKNGNGSSYSTATSYEAQINNFEEKIEITKRNGSSSMLTKSERDNLYFSLTLLCR